MGPDRRKASRLMAKAAKSTFGPYCWVVRLSGGPSDLGTLSM